MTTTCFLNLPPLTSNQSSKASPIPAKPLSSLKNESCCWKRQCVVMGVASYVIGVEMCNSMTLPHETLQITTFPIAHQVSNVSGGAAAKWSQKRTCPPWQGNSLETIVPENLPRPSARRRYEAVRSSSQTAPPLSAPTRLIPSNHGSCFSM
ncbi:uncharacterized protein LOC114162557 [Vigna unguiculata]|uniref:Uncharacterized protein n=1 Tax=Vigna unguiculata TaxID=3917 RepID=A0A4D6NQN4_VIGUN|nr:uncharacterized protein LOC114162557 [Vigna unguiculata]QCE16210.1 hypothetical protein DEO72_LG11g3223 [Vigna unguiculata]